MFDKKKGVTRDLAGGEDENLDLVRGLIGEVLGAGFDAGAVTLDMRLDALGFDSVRYISLMLCFEDIIDLPIEEIARRIDLSKIQTVRDAVELVGELRSSA